MKRFIPFLYLSNVWISALLLIANGLAWFIVASRVELFEAQPILHPEIAEIRAHWQARDAVGETFNVVVTDQVAMETIAWFIAPRSNLPFSHPQVEIHPDGKIKPFNWNTFLNPVRTYLSANIDGHIPDTIYDLNIAA